MWEKYREEYIETVKQLQQVQCSITNLENNFGARIMNSITIDDPNFETRCYDIRLDELNNILYRLEELLTQYVKEEDEWQKQMGEES